MGWSDLCALKAQTPTTSGWNSSAVTGPPTKAKPPLVEGRGVVSKSENVPSGMGSGACSEENWTGREVEESSLQAARIWFFKTVVSVSISCRGQVGEQPR